MAINLPLPNNVKFYTTVRWLYLLIHALFPVPQAARKEQRGLPWIDWLSFWKAGIIERAIDQTSCLGSLYYCKKSMNMHLPARKKLPHTVPDWVRHDSWFFITIKCTPPFKNQLCHTQPAENIFNSIQFNEERQVWSCLLCLLMPAHLHAILKFSNSSGLRTSIENWKKWTARHLKLQWQRDFFDHRLRSSAELDEKISYILLNPVKKGLCTSKEEWPWVYRSPNILP